MSWEEFSVTRPTEVAQLSLQGAHDASKSMVGAGGDTVKMLPTHRHIHIL